jgi:hypothetical protein
VKTDEGTRPEPGQRGIFVQDPAFDQRVKRSTVGLHLPNLHTSQTRRIKIAIRAALELAVDFDDAGGTQKMGMD